ncbi:hypothetical protein B0H11DRAFT_1937097 [Mycena galericulata]|nr:hypothetical protein B0H11DRAFT_1937097 [Mycena galericulata]
MLKTFAPDGRLFLRLRRRSTWNCQRSRSASQPFSDPHVPNDLASALEAVVDAEEDLVQAEKAVRELMPDFTDSDEEMDIDEDSPSLPSMLTAETKDVRAGWDVILEFATTKMSLPQAEKCLKQIFGTGYVASDWKAALDVVMDSEEDSAIAELAVRALMPDFTKDLTAAASSLPAPIANDRRLKEAEGAFADAVQKLRNERCLRGEEASIDELLNPQIEQEDLDSEFLRFVEDDEGTREILEYLKRCDSEEEEEDPQEPEFKFSKNEALNAVAFLQKVAHHRPDLDVALPLAGHLNKFRSALMQEVEESKVQTSITSFFK